MQTLFLIRGIPGSGKSTLARQMANAMQIRYFEADQYFCDENGVYNFNPARLSEAHFWCKEQVHTELQLGKSVIVSNTSTTDAEVIPYQQIAQENHVQFVSIIVENRNNTKSIHNVPEPSIQRMKNRFNIKL